MAPIDWAKGFPARPRTSAGLIERQQLALEARARAGYAGGAAQRVGGICSTAPPRPAHTQETLSMDMSAKPTMHATAARTAYDPRYDPLVAPHPGQGTDYAPTYWVASAGAPPADDGPISGDIDADVVDRRLRLHRPGHRALPGARTRHPRHRARGQPQRLGLHQPQRRPGPERQRAPVPLAVDPALGQGRRRSSSTPRSATASRPSRAWSPSFPNASRRAAATSTPRTARRRWPSCAAKPR